MIKKFDLAKIKIISLDLDGTLLDDSGFASKESIFIMKLLSEKGYIIVINTGRSLIGIPKEISNLNFIDYYIASNGTSIYDGKTKKCIKRTCISFFEAANIINRYKNHIVIFDCLINGKWYMQRRNLNYLNDIIDDKNTLKYISKSRKFIYKLDEYIISNKLNVEKISINLSKDNDKDRKEIMEFIKMNQNIKEWSDKKHKIDIYPTIASKAEAMQFLLRELNIEKEALIAFGDDVNDLELLKFSGISVAMGNALTEIKEISDVITGRNNDDGVKKILSSIYMGENLKDFKSENQMFAL